MQSMIVQDSSKLYKPKPDHKKLIKTHQSTNHQMILSSQQNNFTNNALRKLMDHEVDFNDLRNKALQKITLQNRTAKRSAVLFRPALSMSLPDLSKNIQNSGFFNKKINSQQFDAIILS